MIFDLWEVLSLVATTSLIAFISGFLIGFVRLERDQKKEIPPIDHNDHNFLASMIRKEV